MYKKVIISISNLITYLILGLLLVFFVMQLKNAYNLNGLMYWAGALIALLFLSFLVGFCLAQLFPDRRSSQFAVLFNIIEFIFVFILTLAGLELSEKITGIVKLADEWQVEQLARVLSVSKDIYATQPAVVDTFLTHPALYGLVRLCAKLCELSAGYSKYLTYTMLVLHMVCAYATYRCSRLLSGRVASVVVYAVMLLMPSQMGIAAIRTGYLLVSAVIMLQLWAFHYSRRITRMEKSPWIRLFYITIAGLLIGLATFLYPVAVVLLIAEIIFITCLQLNRSGKNPDSVKMRIVQAIYLPIISACTFAGLCVLKARDLAVSVDRVFAGYQVGFIPSDRILMNLPKVWATETYAENVLYYHSPTENLSAYGGLLGVSFICVILCWYLQEREFFVLRLMFIAMVVYTFISGKTSIEHLPAIAVLAMFSGGLFEKVYSALRRKAFNEMKLRQMDEAMSAADATEDKIIIEEPKEKEEPKLMEEAVKKEEKEATEESSEIEYIENPLPLPKKHVHKDMDFDFDIDDDADFDF